VRGASAQLPHSNDHAGQFAREFLEGFAILPPIVDIETAIAGAGDADGDGRGNYSIEDVTGAAGVVVGGDDDDAVPVVFGDEGRKSAGFFAGAVGIMGKTDDAVFGDTALEEVVLPSARRHPRWGGGGGHWRRRPEPTSDEKVRKREWHDRRRNYRRLK